MVPHPEGVVEVSFRNGHQCVRRIPFNRLCVVKPVPFERNFQSCEQPKVAGGYGGTVAQGSMNALAHYRGEAASHRSPKNAAVFFSLCDAISPELQRKILC